MQLIYIDTLKNISGYKTTESVRRWLTGLRVPCFKVGRQYAVDQEVFDRKFSKKYKIGSRTSEYRPGLQAEVEFFSELQELLYGAMTVTR